MVTGLSEANGNYYYFLESGVYEGAMEFEPIVVGDKQIVFDIHGRVVREIDNSTGELKVLSSTYEKMVGMDDYYEPVQSLIGWN